MFDNFDWNDVWSGVAAVAVFLLVVTGFIAICQPHNVDYYYVSHGSNYMPCSYSHWTWHQDEAAFCSDDPNKVLDFTAKANAALKAR